MADPVPDEIPVTLPGAETAIWQGKPSLWSFAGWFFLCAILVFALGAGLLLAVGVLIYRNSKCYTITNKRVIARTGLFRRKSKEIELNKVERVESAPPPLPIVAGLGDLIIQGDEKIIRMDSIFPCEEIRKLIQERIE